MKWENDGYYVIRSSGSHGKADLVAIKKFGALTGVYLIQCKTKGVISSKDREDLAQLALDLGCTSVIAYNDKDGYKEQWL